MVRTASMVAEGRWTREKSVEASLVASTIHGSNRFSYLLKSETLRIALTTGSGPAEGCVGGGSSPPTRSDKFFWSRFRATSAEIRSSTVTCAFDFFSRPTACTARLWASCQLIVRSDQGVCRKSDWKGAISPTPSCSCPSARASNPDVMAHLAEVRYFDSRSRSRSKGMIGSTFHSNCRSSDSSSVCRDPNLEASAARMGLGAGVRGGSDEGMS